MSKSRSIAQYADVRAILDAALISGGKYTLPSPAMATHWRQRAYHYRSRLRDIDENDHKGERRYAPVTPYDMLLLRIVPDDPCTVLILPTVPEGILTDLNGRTLATPAIAIDPLLETVHDLVGKLAIDI